MTTDLVTMKQAAEMLGVTYRTIQNMVADGRLSKYQQRGGRAVRVDRKEVERMFRKN